MGKLKNKLNDTLEKLKKTIKKFKLTNICILIITILFTINLERDIIKETTLINLVFFFSVFAAGCFLTETVTIERLNKKIGLYSIFAVIAGMFTWLIIETPFSELQNDLFMNNLYRILACYLISIITFAIFLNYKKSKKTFEKYLTRTISNIFKSTCIYGILALGIAIISAVFVYLILDGNDYTLILRMETLLLGIYYFPSILYSLSNEEEEIGKFIKVIIKYVLEILLLIAFAIIYTYIIKILILRSMPSNQIFRILSGLFAAGIFIWTMFDSLEEESTLNKINQKLPLLFSPFILLQIYSIALRIIENGLTQARYLCIIFIIFEIVYTLIYIINKKKIGTILLVFIALTMISTIVPYINMETLSNISQYNRFKVIKEKKDYTQEEKSKIVSAYRYLRYEVDGKKYIGTLSEDEKDTINKLLEEKYNKSDNIFINSEHIYVFNKPKEIDVSGYNHLYFVTSYNSNYLKENDLPKVEDVFRNTAFTSENGEVYKFNIYNKILSYMENSYNIEKYFEKENQIQIDENTKLVLQEISLNYVDTTMNIEHYNLSGYLLTK